MIFELVHAIFDKFTDRRRFGIWKEDCTSLRAVRRRQDRDGISNKNVVLVCIIKWNLFVQKEISGFYQ